MNDTGADCLRSLLFVLCCAVLCFVFGASVSPAAAASCMFTAHCALWFWQQTHKKLTELVPRALRGSIRREIKRDWQHSRREPILIRWEQQAM